MVEIIKFIVYNNILRDCYKKFICQKIGETWKWYPFV